MNVCKTQIWFLWICLISASKKKKIITFLSVVPIQATLPQPGAQTPSERDQVLDVSPNLLAIFPNPATPFGCPKGRSGPASPPDLLTGEPPRAVVLGLVLPSQPGSTLWTLSLFIPHLRVGPHPALAARTPYQAQAPGTTCQGGNCG